MTAGELIRFLEEYDEDEWVELRLQFLDAEPYGGAEAVSNDLTTFSREELEAGRPNRWPTLTAGIALGTCSEVELRRLVELFADVGARLGPSGA